MSDSFSKRMKDENNGPKDHMVHINIGHGCITRYMGPVTVKHGEYIIKEIRRKEEMMELLYPSKGKRIYTMCTLIPLERPPQACDPIDHKYIDLFLRYSDEFMRQYKESDLKSK